MMNFSEIVSDLEVDGMLLRLIDNPTYDFKYCAVASNGLAIQYIEFPCDNIVKKALEQNPKSFCHIKNKSLFSIMYAIYLDKSNYMILNENEKKFLSESLEKDLNNITPYMKLTVLQNIKDYKAVVKE